MTPKPDRMVYMRMHEVATDDIPRSISGRDLARVPAEFTGVLTALSGDLQLALDCIPVFGGMPIQVARALLRNLEPARAAIDYAIKTAPGKDGD